MVKLQQLHLVTALGNAPELVLELLDFFNVSHDYNYSDVTRNVRHQFQNNQITTLHLFCTSFPQIKKALTILQHTMKVEFPAVELKPIQLPMADIATSEDDHLMQTKVEKLFRSLPGKSTIISSAGRKTLTQRITESAMKYGCLGYLAIIGPDNVQRNEYHRLAAIWTPSHQLLQENWQRGKELNKTHIGSSFRCLSVFPLMVQEQLQQEYLGCSTDTKETEIKWLHQLPKADLHCHLGGCQDEPLLQKLAQQLLDDLNVKQHIRQEIQHYFCRRLHIQSISEISPATLRNLTPEKSILHCLENLDKLFSDRPETKQLLIAVLTAGLDVSQIQLLSRDGRLHGDETDWPERNLQSLEWYMKCGDLGGSSLLQSETTLRLALHKLMEESHAENVRYLEVRCSPGNYCKTGLLTINQAMDCLLDEARGFMSRHTSFKINFIIMATRHKSQAELTAHVAAAVLYSKARQDTGPRVVGFDLAGQEEEHDPALFQNDFMPLHHHFLNITIHAGEMADEDKIWQAIYLLHGKRIGHGLQLKSNTKMMGFVRDYGLALEMCPSSNFQTNTFPLFPIPTPTTANAPADIYPLQTYLDFGIEATINTDNRFISDTTMSQEYWQAATMTPGGLSKWQILKLLKSSFQAAFLAKNEKDILLKQIDDEIFTLLIADYFTTTGN